MARAAKDVQESRIKDEAEAMRRRVASTPHTKHQQQRSRLSPKSAQAVHALAAMCKASLVRVSDSRRMGMHGGVQMGGVKDEVTWMRPASFAARERGSNSQEHI